MDIKHLTTKQVKHLKHVYKVAPYKGEAYLKYIRYTQKQDYLKFLKQAYHHFKHGELGGVKLGNVYNNFIYNFTNRFPAYYNDTAGYLYHFDAHNYFDELATGETLAQRINEYVSNNHLSTRQMMMLLTLTRQITNFKYLYCFKINTWNGMLTSIHRANVNDVLKALTLAIHNITHPSYHSKIIKITKIMNNLSNLQIDVQGETSLLICNPIPNVSFYIKDVEKHLGYLKYSHNKIFNHNVKEFNHIAQNIYRKHLKKIPKSTASKLKTLNQPLFRQVYKIKKRLIKEMKLDK